MRIDKVKNDCLVEYRNMKLTPLSQTDIEKLREWRNDKNQTAFLRQIDYITPEMQQNWYEKYLKDDSQIVFAIHETDELKRIVGSVSLYNINIEKKTSEVGRIQIGDIDAHGRGLGRTSLIGAIKVAFRCLDIEKIEASVHKDNVQAHTNDMKIGFRIVGEIDSVVGGKEDLIEMFEEDARRANAYYDDIRISIGDELCC